MQNINYAIRKTNKTNEKNRKRRYSPALSEAITAVAWVVYAAAYFGRINYTVVMPALSARFGWDKAALGMIAGGFFWAYAIGQLVNGVLGDKFNPRIYVAIGLGVSGIMNIAASFVVSFWTMQVIWTLNGFFQSMLWGPIIRTVSFRVKPESRGGATTALYTSTIAGYMGAFLSLGYVARNDWRLAFWIPGVLLLAMALLWVLTVRIQPEDASISSEVEVTPVLTEAKSRLGGSFLSFILKNSLLPLAFVCTLHGVIKESVGSWGPYLLSETHSMDYSDALRLISVVPIVNFLAILLYSWYNKVKGRDFNKNLIFFYAASCVFALVLFIWLHAHPAFALILLALISVTQMAVNAVFTTLLPLSYAKDGRVSSVAGFMDFTVYLGAAISSPAIGFIAEAGGWRRIALLWSGICACALLTLYLTVIKVRKSHRSMKVALKNMLD